VLSAHAESGSQTPATVELAALATQFGGPTNRDFYRTAARLIADAADALEHAHSLGIVHRDVKPGNLMVDAAGKVYVTDFGLARLGADAGLTMSGDLLGTLRYMPPEQVLARHGLVDHRADVYCLVLQP
jgi:serine/threonine protein kinase